MAPQNERRTGIFSKKLLHKIYLPCILDNEDS